MCKLNLTKQRFLSIIVVLALFFCLIPTASPYAEAVINKVGVSIDGTTVSFTDDSGEPFIDENYRTQVPFRRVLETFGADVTWDQTKQTAIAEKDGITVQIPLGANYILKNGVKVQNDTVSVSKKDRIYLPIRIVMEAFGASVSYDYTNNVVVIQSKTSGDDDEEMDAMWISYLDFLSIPHDESGFKSAINTMFDQCVNYGMNAVIVQVRPDSDAMYDSNYFPWSKFASGSQGTDPGYDPLSYMIEAAHARGLKFHAWINPYRITGYKMTESELSSDNPAYIWLHDSDTSNDRWVLSQNGYLYYNPSISQVRQLIISGIQEIVEHYDVDGIHLDDYFYPSIDDTKTSTCFDKPEYDATSSTMTLANWRRNNINLLVKGIYQAVKASNPNVVFGISPAGNLSNLRSNSEYFVDIDTWMSQDGYVDYIMPQLYWGFERKDSSGNLASYSYSNNLSSWIALKKTGNVKLYIGLNVANAGSNVSDGNSTSEWLRYNDIIKRQVLAGRNSGEVSGYAFFRYGVFSTTTASKEVQNLVSILK